MSNTMQPASQASKRQRTATEQSSQLTSALERALQSRRERSLLRSLTVVPPDHVDFASNDYLGLARDPELKRRVINALASGLHDAPLGSTGSRLLTGHCTLAADLEEFLAAFHEAPSALLFNSGFDANLSIISAVPQPGDALVYDELVHNSVHQGIALSRVSPSARRAFAHNDANDLARVLGELRKEQVGNAARSIVVVVESVYSMDGHLAPLKEFCDICASFNASLIVDEAHGTGVLGAGGRGLVSALGLADRVFARVHTFGKAVGSHGAVVVGPSVLREYLMNYARPFIYSTALPMHSLLAIRGGISVHGGGGGRAPGDPSRAGRAL